MEREPQFRPDRYYVLSDAGSLYYDDSGGRDGFASPEGAARWARRQSAWEYGADLDFSDGVTSIIALGAELNANAAVWEEWDARGDWPDAPAVHNYARDLGLVTHPDT